VPHCSHFRVSIITLTMSHVTRNRRPDLRGALCF
jgi:hypothetical protein